MRIGVRAGCGHGQEVAGGKVRRELDGSASTSPDSQCRPTTVTSPRVAAAGRDRGHLVRARRTATAEGCPTSRRRPRRTPASADVLDRPHAVQRHGRVGGERAARLNRDLGGRDAVPRRTPGRRAPAPSGQARRCRAGPRRCTGPRSRRPGPGSPRAEPVRVTHRRQEAEQDVDLLAGTAPVAGPGSRGGRAARRSARPGAGRSARGVRRPRDGDAELRPGVARGDRRMGVAVDARDHAEQHVLDDAGLAARDRVEPVELGGVVDDDQRDAGLHGGRSSSSDLLLPCTTTRDRRVPGPQRGLQLAAGRDQQVQALLDRDPHDGVRRERLHGVATRAAKRARIARSGREGHPRRRRARGVPYRAASSSAGSPATVRPRPMRAEAGHGGPAALPVSGVSACPASPDVPAPARPPLRSSSPRVSRCGTAQPSARSMDSGAETPSNDSRVAIDLLGALASHSRAWVSSASSETTRHSV